MRLRDKESVSGGASARGGASLRRRGLPEGENLEGGRLSEGGGLRTLFSFAKYGIVEAGAL